MMNLADRVRGVLKPPTAAEPAASVPRAGGGGVEEATGGEWRSHPGGRHFVVERRIDAGERHGRTSVGDLAAALEANAAYTSLLTCGAPARAPFVFLDLETTGLSGGAGTYAFLVGCGSFSNDGSFIVRQHLMVSPADERAMLRAVAGELAPAGALVSFNGKSFDAPVLETRYLFHRLAWPAGTLTHVDALHSSRHFWGEVGGCSLVVLESQVLGARRMADVSGMEIPARYFQFLRTGDAQPLAAVLEHNRLDLLSLAGLTSRLVELVAAGPSRCRSAQEAFALGRIYRRSGLDARAHDAFASAFELALPGWSHVRTAALHALALSDRHARRYENAAVRWQALVDAPDCPALVRRAAAEALAIHHEHRVRDLPAARAFALKSLDSPGGPAWRDAVRRRVTRIDRKLGEDIGRRAGIDPPIQLLLEVAPRD
jgi:uncharacterized protein YprB with RNaseH-like and TPR domain